MGRVREKLRRCLTLSMTVALVGGLLPGTVYASKGRNAEALEKAYNTTGTYVKNEVKAKADKDNLYGSEWYIIGLARTGVINHDSDLAKRYYYAAYDKAKSKGSRLGSKAEENARVIMALTALGYDPENIAGRNLILGFSDRDFVEKDGLMGVIYTLIALNSGNYGDPSATVTKESLRDKIVGQANIGSGGWTSFGFGGTANPDVTALAIIALSPYYHTGDAKVDEAIDKAMKELSELQNANGGYTVDDNGSKNDLCESTARVIAGLTSVGVDPDFDGYFIKNSGYNSLIDSLLRFSISGGGFKHKTTDTSVNADATAQGYLALAAYYRLYNKKNALFDMTDVKITKPNPIRPIDVKSIKFTKTSVDLTYNPTTKSYTGAPLELGNLLEITPLSGSKVKALGANVTQTWTVSSGASLVTLDKSTGRLTPKANANGTVKIKVTVKDNRNVTATANITVKITGPTKAKSVKVTYKKKTKETIEKDASIVLTSAVSPTNAAIHEVTWKADKKSYVTLTPS
ncbi:MAG: hypothetical protein IK054_07945, partial [Lachnospiraceae bacterium]|nr:hypothetical protein [Lachnospiraceae bacterium]